MSDEKSVIKAEIGDICLESYPCQHWVKISYADGSTKKKCLGARYIAENFKNFMDEFQVRHFSYVIEDEIEIDLWE